MGLTKNEKVIITLVVTVALVNFYLQHNAQKKMEELKELIKNK
jgi:preprotein translocase subunit YajC